jgi:hypothetical protein
MCACIMSTQICSTRLSFGQDGSSGIKGPIGGYVGIGGHGGQVGPRRDNGQEMGRGHGGNGVGSKGIKGGQGGTIGVKWCQVGSGE